MARTIGKLSAKAVEKAKPKHATRPMLYADGGGLYLQVSASGTKSWVFRFMLNGKSREMGLGPFGDPAHPTITLELARERAADCRRQRHFGIDPIESRRAERAARALEAARAVTFRQAAETYIEAHRASWRNPKHAAQWTNTLTTYAYPVIGNLPVAVIDVSHVTKVIEPLWSTKTETASRLRGRIESILDAATAKKLRAGENPARWRGHLENLLPKRAKVRKVKHHAALPYPEMHAFMTALRGQDGTAARAMAFVILTAARTGEAIGARWSEIGDDGVWIVPGERMKAGNEHRVPLSAPALAILRGMRPEGEDEPDGYIFPGGKAGEPLSNMAMLELLRRMGRADVTVHGFRSTFRDWAAERTTFPAEVAEMALAHVIDDKTRAAYQRGDLFAKRKQLMDAWARYCETKPAEAAKVVSIAARAK
jgi:integrase